MDDFYKEHILDHYRNPRNFGTLDNPTVHFEDRNPLCGDELRVDLLVNADGTVQDVRFSGKGCAISQASMSMLSELLTGMPLTDVARMQKESVLDELGIGISPARMKCAMLGLKVVRSAALGEIAKWPDEETA
jgi:nitrogen fixation NifU-like protein